ncbi:YopX family protein, partial [Sphingobacterium sp. ML3W]
MNRQIKFRGLRTDGEGWLYGDLSHVNEQVLISPKWEYPNQWDNVDMNVIPETVGQFTGLTDKNGTEIYEGDIISGDDYPFIDEGKQNYVGVVEWIFAGFQYVLKCVNPEKRGISDGVNDIIEDSGWM